MDANETMRKWDLYFMGMTNEKKRMLGFEIDENKTIVWDRKSLKYNWLYE